MKFPWSKSKSKSVVLGETSVEQVGTRLKLVRGDLQRSLAELDHAMSCLREQIESENAGSAGGTN